MRHGKYEKHTAVFPAIWVILALAITIAGIGGARAYLSAASSPATYELVTADYPTVSVTCGENSGAISVNAAYPVYVRCYVAVNWKSTSGDGNILADMPVKGTDYELSMAAGWRTIGDFYYYDTAIQTYSSAAPVVTVIPKTVKDGYKLNVTLIAQVIQADGETDADGKKAVENAWGVTVQQITGS